MLSPKMQKALNKQVNAELYSAYLYLSMSAHCQSISLPGFAHWLRVQTMEELVHAMKLYDFVNERGSKVELGPIEGPPITWKTPLAIFEHTQRHEQKVTGLINNLVNRARAEKNHASVAFLQWFVTEQVEEESSANEVVQKLKLAGTDKLALLLLDKDVATRVFTPPAGTKPGDAQVLGFLTQG